MAQRASERLIVGQVYTREELREAFAIQDATLNTGIFQPRDSDSIWLFVTENKTPDRTQYRDRLDGDMLEWDSQASGRKDHLIIQHRQLDLEILVFYRTEKYQYPRAGFRYEGPFHYRSHSGQKPAHFVLVRDAGVAAIYPDEVPQSARMVEGAVRMVQVNAYERNPAARKACILHHGARCVVCGFDFGRAYGPMGAGFIHVHHLRQLSDIKDRYEVDPVRDLRPVCPNCHAMLHSDSPPMDVEELKRMVQRRARTS